MFLDVLVLLVVFGLGDPAPADPILIPVAAEDLARCQATLAQVMAGPLATDAPGLILATQPAREVRCVALQPGEAVD